jgi:hypothetical protein
VGVTLIETCDRDDREQKALVGRFTGLSFEADGIEVCYRKLRAKPDTRAEISSRSHTWLTFFSGKH